MDTFKTITNSGIAVATALLFGGLPAQARFDGLSWQPKAGAIGFQETKLAAELNGDFKAGLIDTNELSMLTRDLDAIREKEDELRMDHNGMGIKDEEHVLKKLAQFQCDLNRATEDKYYTITVSVNGVHS